MIAIAGLWLANPCSTYRIATWLCQRVDAFILSVILYVVATFSLWLVWLEIRGWWGNISHLGLLQKILASGIGARFYPSRLHGYDGDDPIFDCGDVSKMCGWLISLQATPVLYRNLNGTQKSAWFLQAIEMIILFQADDDAHIRKCVDIYHVEFQDPELFQAGGGVDFGFVS